MLNLICQVRSGRPHQLHGAPSVPLAATHSHPFFLRPPPPYPHHLAPLAGALHRPAPAPQVGTTPQQHYIVAPFRLVAIDNQDFAGSNVAAFMG
jgi:hypothetical protein